MSGYVVVVVVVLSCRVDVVVCNVCCGWEGFDVGGCAYSWCDVAGVGFVVGGDTDAGVVVVLSYKCCFTSLILLSGVVVLSFVLCFVHVTIMLSLAAVLSVVVPWLFSCRVTMILVAVVVSMLQDRVVGW